MVVANEFTATALSARAVGTAASQIAPAPAAGWRRRVRSSALAALAAIGLLVPGAAGAASNKVRISNLTDLAFGTVADLTSDDVLGESLCLYSDTATNGYNVTASGTGPSGAFQLSSGLSSLSYDVQWSSSAGRTSGTQLTPNVPLTGQTSTATHQVCANGPANSASLIVVLRSAALSSATAGSYSGTLTLVVGAE